MNEREDYLVDPAATSDREIAALEKALLPLRYRPEEHPLSLPARQPKRRGRTRRKLIGGVALAATIALFALGLRAWLWSWPAARPWSVSIAATDRHFTLGEGELLEPDHPAMVRIARIGRMHVAPGTSLRLIRTEGVQHQLQMEEGSVSVGVWAPPFSVGIDTPAGSVFDLGCAFDLTVRDDIAVVVVTSGWVKLQNRRGQVLVPQGSTSKMNAAETPSVPVRTDASAELVAAIRRIEAGEGSASEMHLVRRAATRRDAYTLLLLAERSIRNRAELLAHVEQLAPAPSDAVRSASERGDPYAIHAWAMTLDLPPPKGWLRNWRDAIVPPSPAGTR